ncbi:Alanine--tRNA ligase [Porphyridium purpureum]|uniref:Alanine--tRNA ligase n=1 Tax=Porphyridium purpureum TaxID=35688 RepID=A0A5J4YRJ0_PORPP|nr:Alanine--tRNA ligase [Porphyridium purpureum]|eukprot:POR2268..scf229_5
MDGIGVGDAEMSGLGRAAGWPSRIVRQTFIDFFVRSHDHVMVPSSSVVPHEDPTLLFANAGMNQFKAIFLGQVDPNAPMARLKRAVNSQKCIRAGGKHNDLDDVGKDTYHHTFFEMLGNWSFGDYFKTEAIDMAFKLLVSVYGLDPARLYATYFGGNEGVPADDEARNLWLKYLPAERVLPFDAKDNFWEMGDTGPCGPCTELHYDRIGGGRDAAAMVNADDPNVIEIWNLVFIQFNREPDGSLRALPNKHVDTGMGFERITSILQNKLSNYDTDVFTPIFDAIQKVTGAPAYTGKLGVREPDALRDMAYRVVADHIRTLSFAIADGAVPSNEGRGYVLRRILRRAVRYGNQFLDFKPGYFSSLVPSLCSHMGEFFPELRTKQQLIYDIIHDEEMTFTRTLSRGLERFSKFAALAEEQHTSMISGKDAFFLYDTMGFPLDLTQLMAEERGMSVDVEGYNVAMEEAKARSRADRSKGSAISGGAGGRLVLEAEQTDALMNALSVPITDSTLKYVWYKTPRVTVRAIFGGSAVGFCDSLAQLAQKLDVASSSPNPSIEAGVPFGIVTDRTSFYAEQGGQVADTGKIYVSGSTNESSLEPFDLEVLDVQVFGGYVLHVATLGRGSPAGADVRVGQEVELAVDYERRALIAPNHTLTHVLNYALRKVLGTDADQRGSLVDDSKLRFDFAYNKPLSEHELEAVEAEVRAQIQAQLTVYDRVIPLADAKNIHSLRAVFGEVYPDPVRVISVGVPVQDLVQDPESQAWTAYSIELCGGTHLENTGQAHSFALIEEGSVAKGVRRITACTSDLAASALKRGEDLSALVSDLEHMASREDRLTQLLDNADPKSIAAVGKQIDDAVISAHVKLRLRTRMGSIKEKAMKAQKEAQALRQAQAMEAALTLSQQASADGRKLVVAAVPTDAKSAPKLVSAMQDVLGDKACVLIVSADDAKGKVNLWASSKDDRLSAVDWAGHCLSSLGGKAGGKTGFAQGSISVGAGASAAMSPAQGVEQIMQLAAEFADALKLE